MDVGEVVSGRAGPEGVRAVLHSSTLRRTLRATLGGMSAEPDRLGPCRLRRSKFKPGHKLTAYFDTGLPPHGARRAVAVRWWQTGAGPEPSLADADAETEAVSRGRRGVRLFLSLLFHVRLSIEQARSHQFNAQALWRRYYSRLCRGRRLR